MFGTGSICMIVGDAVLLISGVLNLLCSEHLGDFGYIEMHMSIP